MNMDEHVNSGNETLRQYIERRYKDSEQALKTLGVGMMVADGAFIEALWTKQFYQDRVAELQDCLDALEDVATVNKELFMVKGLLSSLFHISDYVGDKEVLKKIIANYLNK